MWVASSKGSAKHDFFLIVGYMPEPSTTVTIFGEEALTLPLNSRAGTHLCVVLMYGTESRISGDLLSHDFDAINQMMDIGIPNMLHLQVESIL
jgi:hypothetical protein